MTRLMIVESNTPDMVARGGAASAGFIRSLSRLAPDAVVTVVAPYGGAVPDSALDGIDGVIFTGSGVSWSTASQEAAPLREVMSRVFDHGLPSYGSCNGLQLAAVVLGGGVDASPNGFEVGVAKDMRLTEAGQTHPFMTGRKDGFAIPCIHRDEVSTLPAGAVLLAGNDHSPVQAMVYEQGNICFWGVQYHPELTPGDIAHYLRKGDSIFHGKDDLIADLSLAEADEAAAARIGGDRALLAGPDRDRELANWVTLVKARSS